MSMKKTSRSERQILETKQKITNLFRTRDQVAAIKLFYKFFTEENPADAEFVNFVYLEINRRRLFEEGYKFMKTTAVWHPDNPHIQDLLDNSVAIYFENLALKGNNLLSEYDEKSVRFAKGLSRLDMLSRERMRTENTKTLTSICNNALEHFLKAYSLRPQTPSPSIIKGLTRCYTLLGDEKKIEDLERVTNELYGNVSKNEPHEAPVKPPPQKAPELLIEVEPAKIEHLENLLTEKKYDELIEAVDLLHKDYVISVPLLLLKVKALVELKKFKPIEAILSSAETQNRYLKEIKETRNYVNETKRQILVTAGSVYLKKAMTLGPTMGRRHFMMARDLLEKAVKIVPGDLDLLDQLYTAYKYLGEEDGAFDAKAVMYHVNQSFTPTFDRKNSSSLCFIASFAFVGQPETVNEFRWFRREFLLQSKSGRQLNSFYVRWSPKFVNFATHYAIARPLCRFLLLPFLLFIRFLKLFD
ncbi:MAG: hypothetical protein EOM80_10985 [Erysipelotrichia bacterium]|nr:hypothetical protein [Erysipelotrichia bacterium]